MTLTLTLKSSPKFKIFEKYQLRKSFRNMLGYYAQGVIYCWRRRSRSWSIKRSNSLNWLTSHLIVTETSNLVHILVYGLLKSRTKYGLDLEKFTKVKIFETSIKENQPKYAWILCTGHKLLLASKVLVDQKVKFAYLAITSHLIVTETSNLVHILVYEKPHQL